jgi:hypothetical protein
MDTDTDRDMDVAWTWADPETFCRGDVLLGDVLLGDVLLGDVLLQGDVLSRRRFVKKMFFWETFCRRDVL